MIIFKHRINSINELKITPVDLGIEVDIRSYKNKIIVNHEPFLDSISFDDWLKFYKHRFLIVNLKEEGLENSVLEKLEKFNIQNFFFLDQSFPFLIKTVTSGEKRTAVRVSKYESLDTALALSNLANWIWVDYFGSFPLKNSEIEKLKNANFKICLVSPELQGFSLSYTENFKREINNKGFVFEGICTKFPKLWKS